MRTLLLLFSVSCLRGMAQFGPAVVVQSGLNVNPHPNNGGSSSSFRIEDVDGDGWSDVVHMVWPTSIYWIRNSDGLGTFSIAEPILLSNNEKILYDLVDLDLDGDLDAVVYERNADQHSISMIENLGNGSFATPVLLISSPGMAIPVTSYAESIDQLVCADLTGDGLTEIVYTTRGGFRWLINEGNMEFSSVQIFNIGAVDHLSQKLRFGDMDGDSNVDIVTSSSDGLYAALNINGDGSQLVDYFFNSTSSSDGNENITLVDIDEDGDLDILAIGWSIKWYESPVAQIGLDLFEYHWIEPGENEGSSSIGRLGCNSSPTIVYGRWPWQANDWNLRWTHFDDQLGDFTTPSFNETPKARYYRLADINNDDHLDLVTLMNDTTRWYPYDPNYLTQILDLQLPFDTIALNDGPQQLIGGSPEGGTYSLSGSANTLTVFDPIEAGVGDHQMVYSYTDPFTGCSGSDTAMVVVELSTGIARNDRDVGIEVFPNPVNDHCTVVFENGPLDLLLIDATGRIVHQWPAASSPFLADISDVPAGIFMIRAREHDHTTELKLIVH